MDLTYRLVRVPGGHGADDYEDDLGRAYTLFVNADGREAGSLDFNIKAGPTLWVRWIEINEDMQRRGIATALMTEAERRFPKAVVDTGGFSDDGEEFWTAIGRSV